MYVAAALELRDGDRERLEAVTGASTAPAGLVSRARIVLLAAEGVPNSEIAAQTSSSRRYSGGVIATLNSASAAWVTCLDQAVNRRSTK
jgi:hypothetical protein